MANINYTMPWLIARRRCAAATAFALVVTGTLCLQDASAQIEVEVITSGTKTGSQDSSANSQPAVQTPTVDSSADDAARKILPAPGTKLQSTENSSLSSREAVVAAPSLSFKDDQLVLKAGETTESMAVHSGAELLRMLGVKSKDAKPEGGLELEEDTTNTLFDVAAVQRLKGEKPTVVYRVVVENEALPDPMIVPWIRQAKLLQERFDRAVQMLGDNHIEDGRQELLAIVSDFPDSDYATQSRGLLKKLDELSKSDMPQPTIKTVETTITVELSPNIQIGTTLIEPGDAAGNRVMINGRTYKVGEFIKGVPNHQILDITDNAVKIEVEQSGLKKTFEVPVRPTGTNNN